MERLKILASGDSRQARAQARGHLFEDLMSLVLRRYGYSVDARPNVNYAGMEIDIEGKATVAGTPMYAECKCHETDVAAPDLQSFFGKYMTRWLKDRRCHGLFIALPGVNSHAKGFYRDNCEENREITCRLIEEAQVLVLQRRFKEGCPEIHEGRLGAWHGSAWLVRYYPAYPRATAAAHPARTVPGAAFPAPPGRPEAS